MPDNYSKLPTIRDVAELAHVSASTVSYVLNGRGGEASRISRETHERVLAAVDQLGYIQNNTARHLRRRTTERVCLALPSLGRPYHDELAQQLSKTAREFGYSVVVSVGGTLETNIGILNDVRSGLADGIILDINDAEDDRIVPKLEELSNSHIAVIVLGSNLSGKGFDVMDTTEGQAVASAMAYLIGRGHRRIAYIAHQIEHGSPIGQRYHSYARALDEAGIPIDPKLIVEGAASREDAYQNAQLLLSLATPPTAIFSASDIGALSAIAAARDLGFRIPDDVAVIGCGNVFESRISFPRLTTVGPTSLDFRIPIHYLFERLKSDEAIDQRQFVQKWELNIRESA